jgi:hypothetical protein
MTPGQAVINLTGATHDAICYEASIFIPRASTNRPTIRATGPVLNELGVEADNAGKPVDTTVGQPADICTGIMARAPGARPRRDASDSV